MNIRTPKDLGLFVREQRRKHALDQKSLAAKVGVSRQWIIQCEKGKPGISVGLALRTLRVLGVTLRASSAAPVNQVAPEFPATEVDIDAIVDRARGPRQR